VSGDPRADIRRFAGWALVGGLSVAAFTAVVALLLGDFDDTEVKVILTSIGFAIASSTGAAGAAQRLRASNILHAVGTLTAGLSAISFVLLVAGLWTGDWGSEGVWRAFGCTALVALGGAHICLVLGARRLTDGDVIRLLVNASLVLAAIDVIGALLPISGISDDVDEGAAQLLAATLVLLVLSTVLPPILRRMRVGTAPRPAGGGARDEALDFLAGEVESIAIRIADLSSGPAISTPQIRREAERLRDLARSFQS
jgi:hypothetical protein